MKESRVFSLNGNDVQQVAERVVAFLRSEKKMEVQSAPLPNGCLIQAAQADTLRTLSGMKLATTVELTVNGEQLNVLIGEGQWSDKLGAGAVGLFLLWPLAITAGIGAYKQKMLPEEIFDVVRRNTMPGVSAEAEAPAAEKRICPQCHAENSCDARFCNACGAKLTLTCPQCGAPLAAGSRFCSQCGQPLG